MNAKTKANISNLVFLAIGVLLGGVVTPHLLYAKQQISEAILDGLVTTKAFDGTVLLWKVEQVVGQAVDNPRRLRWETQEPDEMQMISISGFDDVAVPCPVEAEDSQNKREMTQPGS
jgi:hypothetical protein